MTMSDDQDMARISRSVPLDQLRAPETDVRIHRPRDQVKSLAASMGDPDVGQLQDVLVHPVEDDLEGTPTEPEDLHDLFTDGVPLRVVDGETRRQAARELGWSTLSCTIVPEPPEDTVVAQLDANTERIEMDEFETVRALYEHYEDTSKTLAEIGEAVGFSESYVSRVFSLMESPDWLTDPWRAPEHNLETSHALAVMSMLSKNSLESYLEAGADDPDHARELAREDARLMIDVQQEHDLQVTDYRKRVKRCQKETKDQLRSSEDPAETQARSQREAAERDHTGTAPPDPDPCLVCGGDRTHRRKFAVPVCEQDYGMLSDQQASGDPLMAQGGSSGSTAPDPREDPDVARDAVDRVLALALGIPEDQARQAFRTLEDQVQAVPTQDDD